MKHTEEWKRKHSEMMKGNKHILGRHWKLSEETKRKMRKPKTEEHRKKISEARTGEGNGMWKGDDVGYGAVHTWIKKYHPKPEYCEMCGLSKSYDLANITGIYNREFKNWMYMCRKCHMISDKRILNLKNQTVEVLGMNM